MKLKALPLALALTIGIFFSGLGVSRVQAQIPTNNILYSPIKQINAYISGVAAELNKSQSGESEINKASFDNTSLDNFMSGLVCNITGCGSQTDIIGAVPAVGSAIASIYSNSPASGQTYVADLFQNLKVGPASPAYAQGAGLGFSSLEPILAAWKQFRNIAYMFFIIITLIVGFMIMMRQKIGGQAAVTAQQAIPNIVIALITVTFSYAIAGFMIDLMYIFMFIIIGLFPQLNGETGLISQNILQISGEMLGGSLGSTHLAVGNFISDAIGGGPVSDAIGWVGGLTFAVIIAFAFLFATVSLFFELLKTYIGLIISIVLSPLVLMLGALPGRSDVFKDWLKGLFSNLIAYPTVLLLIILHRLMTTNTSLSGGFLPPYLTGRGNAGDISVLIGLAIMLISKDLVVQAKKSIAPKGSSIFEQLGSALSSAISKGWKGGQLIPGVGLTDTNKLPVLKHMGSGKNVMSNFGSGAGGLAGAAWGALRTPADRMVGARIRGTQAAEAMAKQTGGTLFKPQKPDAKTGK